MTIRVVGAGIAGLSAAALLARRGQPVEVLEAAADPGGLLAPIDFEGVACDRGSHRVHPSSHPLLRELTGAADWRVRERAGRLIFGGRHLRYPPDPLRFIYGLGPRATLRMGLGWLMQPARLRRIARWEDERRDTDDDIGFERFVIRRVGGSAYRRFYRPYAVKVWGVDPATLSQSVAKQRVSTSSPVSAFLGRQTHTFLYPHHGMAALIDVLLDQLRARGVEVQFGRRYVRDEWDEPVLYSGHLDDLVARDETHLGHRGLYLLHISVPDDCLDDTDTWYSPEAQFWFGRVSQPARFSSALSIEGRRVLCVEIPEGRWGPSRDFLPDLSTLMDQLHAAGILRRRVDALAARQTFVPRVYPMYVRGWLSRWRASMRHVASMGNVFPIGRQGVFLHCNMDHAVQISSDAVDHLLAGKSAAAWANRCSDYLGLRVRD